MSVIDELRAVSDRYFAAWPAKDFDTIADIEDGLGFGHSTAFPRRAGDTDERRSQLKSYFDMMDWVRIALINREFGVIGQTGIEWGHYSQSTKQKDGPIRTVHLRFTSTYAKREGEWKLVIYHRSKIPSEDIP